MLLFLLDFRFVFILVKKMFFTLSWCGVHHGSVLRTYMFLSYILPLGQILGEFYMLLEDQNFFLIHWNVGTDNSDFINILFYGLILRNTEGRMYKYEIAVLRWFMIT